MDGPPPPARYAAPNGVCKPKGQCWAPTQAHPHPQHVGGGPGQPARMAGSRGGGAPELRRPSQPRKAPPPGTPFCHPHSAQRQLTRAHAVGPLLGPQGHTNCTRDTRAAETRLPAPKGGRSGEGQRLTPDAPHKGGRPPPPGDGLPPPPLYAAPHGVYKPKGQCWAPTPAHPHPQQVGGGPRQPSRRAGSRGKGSA